jgi:NitT/TauT family transport system substrate-binding protein
MNTNKFIRGAAATFILALAGTAAHAADKVIFGSNWRAQAEHGGYYQAVAMGIYAKYNLDVEIRQGGPQVNHPQLLAAGRIDFNMGSNVFEDLNFVQSNVPMVNVAAIFQKDPQVLIAHPGAGNDSLAAMKGKPILISKTAITTFWQFLKSTYGFTDDQIRPYTFNPAPFLADKSAIQQGYVTSEPLAIEKQGKFKPVVHLLADQGYGSYSTTIQTTKKLVQEKPQLVQRFVDATIEGWYSYLNSADVSKANALIKKDNAEMDDEQLAYSIAKMKEYGIVDSGDAKAMGVGAMTDKRWKDFFDFTVKAGLYPANLDYKSAYTLQFVNKKVGMN